MNVLIDGRVLHNGAVSGIPEYARLLITHFFNCEQKNKYTIFCNSFRNEICGASLFSKEKNLGLMEWGFPNKLLDLQFNLFNFPKIDRGHNFDVLFSPHFNSISSYAKRVLTFHDISFVRFPEFYSFRKRIWHALQNPKLQANRASKIIAVSESTKNDLIEFYGINSNKIDVVYSGINPLFLSYVSDEDIISFKKRNLLDKPFILFLGTLEPRKNVDGAIRAFSILKTKKQFSDLQFVIIGSRGWLCDKIFKEANNSRYSKDIRFYEASSNADVKMFYHLADVFVFPSFFEGFGFPVLEAQACGTPVVSSNRGALGEILNDSALFVDPNKPNEIADSVEYILKNPATAEKLKKAGIDNAKRFDWNNSARKTLEIFSKL